MALECPISLDLSCEAWSQDGLLTGDTKIREKKTRTNSQIKVLEVRLIDEEGNQVGVVSIADALGRAEGVGLDLVEISPNAEPPVCRIMDHGKFLFEANKRKAVQKKKQKSIQVKEIKFRPGTDEGDLQVKIRKIVSFIENGDKVKLTLRFRGREMQHRELGMALLQRICVELGDKVTVEQQPKLEGKQMAMVVAPSKQN